MARMRKEARLWLAQSLRDLEVAGNSFRAGDWYAVAFWCHQAAEKALKALLLSKGIALRGHNLLELGRKLGELNLDPGELWRDLRRLNPHYTVARYPDAANALPCEVYDREAALEALEAARRVVEWAKRILS